MIEKIEDYTSFREGDLVVTKSKGSKKITGIITRVHEYGQIDVLWDNDQKIFTHGKKWAEFHIEILGGCSS